jgi:glycosyltransferase involved in cell wall biosynthesis
VKIVFLLQASSTVAKGGAEYQADLIMNEMIEAGHEITCISEMVEKPGPGLPDVEYRYLTSRGRRLALLNFSSLCKELDRIEPEIIYQRDRVPYTGMAAWYTKRHRCKMVFNIANVEGPKKNRVPLNKLFLFHFVNEHVGRYGIRNCSAIVAQTFDQKDDLQRNFGRDCVVIRNGHPVPPPPFEKSSPPVVIWVSNVKHIKRLDVFLDLAEELQDTPAQFVYVGRSSSDSYLKTLDERASSLDNVSHLGELPYDETNDMIAKASVLVNTSTSEGFPNTFIQAWLRETPVVSLTADPDGILKKHKIGLCSGSFEKFVSDVRSLIEDTNQRALFGKKSREYAVENHDIKKTGKKYLDLFEQLHGQD